MNALEITNLNKDLGSFKLQNINLDLPKGYILGYIGQNGAGKTTTIKLIMEHLKKDSGRITVFGKEFKDNEFEFRDIIGFIADENYFPASFKANDIIATLKDFYPSFDEEKFKAYMLRWELPLDKKIKDFSKGMQMKLMFASVLARKTKLLILDEPTSGLDPVIRDELLEILQEYIQDGEKSVLFSTHIMSDLEKIADYLYFINKGKCIFNDTKDNVMENYLIVKGGNEDLTPEIKAKLIGFKKSPIGFEGLIFLKNKNYMSSKMLLEKPCIDDIVVFHILGSKEAI
jgi:ABC-2 type transport system ATP-binding protein